MLSACVATHPPAPVIPTVDVELQISGGMAEGVAKPSVQRLRIPKDLLEHPDQVPIAAGGSVQLLAHGNQSLRFSLGITGAGWQARARESAELSLSRLTLGPVLEFGLRELVAPTALYPQYGIPTTTYFGEDSELGFVHAVCSGGMVQRGSRDCSVESELTPNLILSVTVREDELPIWRARALHARALSLGMLVP
jgi:hypothetical protein